MNRIAPELTDIHHIKLSYSKDQYDGHPRQCENDVVVWDYNCPLEAHRARLWKTDGQGVAREQIDLASPDAAIYFARSMIGRAGDDGKPTQECFAFRSGDRGRTWETVPTRVFPPPGLKHAHVDGYPLAKFPDGTQMAVAYVGSSSD